ncbi:hypothetical protein SS50377_23961 [Spironucleus salmonicida]|uniref:Uncharacterized protein n=1 Tax=Spironucleus salmonicida TaxID=348837 RepID=A0A9P8RYP7_9EUKA|nr:hypothetical protein SS50377_23961 [Spironucleus salmonicida]
MERKIKFNIKFIKSYFTLILIIIEKYLICYNWSEILNLKRVSALILCQTRPSVIFFRPLTFLAPKLENRLPHTIKLASHTQRLVSLYRLSIQRDWPCAVQANRQLQFKRPSTLQPAGCSQFGVRNAARSNAFWDLPKWSDSPISGKVQLPNHAGIAHVLQRMNIPNQAQLRTLPSIFQCPFRSPPTFHRREIRIFALKVCPRVSELLPRARAQTRLSGTCCLECLILKRTLRANANAAICDRK